MADNCPYPKQSEFRDDGTLNHDVRFLQLAGDLFRGVCTLERIARLRNLALSQVEDDLVAFLDDDNKWAPNHLQSLYNRMAETGSPAVHSWRLMVDVNDQPIFVDSFPWLLDPRKSQERFQLLSELGLMSKDSAVVRDRHRAVSNGVDYGMVDVGEWLFHTAVLKSVGFRTQFSRADEIDMIGEDDKLLSDIKILGLPVACTEAPTLLYTLGGISNRKYQRYHKFSTQGVG